MRYYIIPHLYFIILLSLSFLIFVGAPLLPLNASQNEKTENVKPQFMRGIELFGLMINGKFDLTFELDDFRTKFLSGSPSLKNYHHFIFISGRKNMFFFTAEVIERWFYEFGAKFGSASFKLGKILVPFGADPLFHHSYGGLSGFDQRLIPFIWSEHGADLSFNLKGSNFLLINELYTVTAPRGNPGEVLLLTSQSSFNKFAVGDRLTLGYSGVIIYLSLYWNQYLGRYDSFLWGGDISFPYNFIPYLHFLSLSFGFLNADIEGEPTSMTLGKYSHFGNYIRASFMLPLNLEMRVMMGKQLINDGKTSYSIPSLFIPFSLRPRPPFTSTFNFALMMRRSFFFSQIQYIMSFGKDRIDKFRIMTGVEF